MIDYDAGNCCQQQSFDIYHQPEDDFYSTEYVRRWLWVKYDAVQEDYDVGDVADKAADITELHKSIHLAD